MRVLTPLFAVLLGLACPACGTADHGSDAVGQDARSDGLDPSDVVPDQNGDASDVGPDDVEIVPNEWGFPIRKPRMHHFGYESPYASEPQVLDILDADWLCTFVHGDVSAVVYAPHEATGLGDLSVTWFPVPAFAAEHAWMWTDGQLSDLGPSTYDWGGNHHNDSLQIDVAGHHYEYFHSSIGFGGRSCQNVDCLKVYSAEGVPIEEDGCTAERTLPVVCVGINEDGTWPDLVDTFAKCPGDPNR